MPQRRRSADLPDHLQDEPARKYARNNDQTEYGDRNSKPEGEPVGSGKSEAAEDCDKHEPESESNR